MSRSMAPATVLRPPPIETAWAGQAFEPSPRPHGSYSLPLFEGERARRSGIDVPRIHWPAALPWIEPPPPRLRTLEALGGLGGGA